jgi:YD repeat-containing protein
LAVFLSWNRRSRGQPSNYDANGNLLSDGQRAYNWDAEDRLIQITYPGEAGKQTDFVYDGLDRRTAIIRTPAGGGGAVTTSYVWCGTHICQARARRRHHPVNYDD